MEDGTDFFHLAKFPVTAEFSEEKGGGEEGGDEGSEEGSEERSEEGSEDSKDDDPLAQRKDARV